MIELSSEVLEQKLWGLCFFRIFLASFNEKLIKEVNVMTIVVVKKKHPVKATLIGAAIGVAGFMTVSLIRHCLR